MMKLGAVLFAIAVPFLAFTDGCVIFYTRCVEGFDLVIEMWRCE